MNSPVWQCPCGAYTPIGRYFCGTCGARFSRTSRLIPAGRGWQRTAVDAEVAGSNPAVGLSLGFSDSHFTARNSQARTPGQQQFGGDCFVPALPNILGRVINSNLTAALRPVGGGASARASAPHSNNTDSPRRTKAPASPARLLASRRTSLPAACRWAV